MTLLVFVSLFRALTTYDDAEQIHGENVAAALSYAGVTIAVGIVVARAVEGDFEGWLTSLKGYGGVLLSLVALYPVRQLFVQSAPPALAAPPPRRRARRGDRRASGASAWRRSRRRSYLATALAIAQARMTSAEAAPEAVRRLRRAHRRERRPHATRGSTGAPASARSRWCSTPPATRRALPRRRGGRGGLPRDDAVLLDEPRLARGRSSGSRRSSRRCGPRRRRCGTASRAPTSSSRTTASPWPSSTATRPPGRRRPSSSASSRPAATGLVDPNRELEARFLSMLEFVARRERLPGAGPARTVGLVYPTEFTDDLSLVRLYSRWLEGRGYSRRPRLAVQPRPSRAGALASSTCPSTCCVRHYKTDWWGERQSAWLDDAHRRRGAPRGPAARGPLRHGGGRARGGEPVRRGRAAEQALDGAHVGADPPLLAARRRRRSSGTSR